MRYHYAKWSTKTGCYICRFPSTSDRDAKTGSLPEFNRIDSKTAIQNASGEEWFSADAFDYCKTE